MAKLTSVSLSMILADRDKGVPRVKGPYKQHWPADSDRPKGMTVDAFNALRRCLGDGPSMKGGARAEVRASDMLTANELLRLTFACEPDLVSWLKACRIVDVELEAPHDSAFEPAIYLDVRRPQPQTRLYGHTGRLSTFQDRGFGATRALTALSQWLDGPRASPLALAVITKRDQHDMAASLCQVISDARLPHRGLLVVSVEGLIDSALSSDPRVPHRYVLPDPGEPLTRRETGRRSRRPASDG